MSSILENLRKLLAFRSVMGEPCDGAPFGKENRDALDFFLGLGSEMGFSTYNADGYAGHIEFGGGDITVGILAHLDVVPEGGGWTSGAFVPEVRDGKLYARGAMDDKGPAMAALYAMKKVRDRCEKSGEKFPARVRLIVGCNEENGSKCIEYYKSKVKMPDIAFSPDADFPLINCEKGLMGYKITVPFDGFCKTHIAGISGGIAHNAVPDYAECVLKDIDAAALENTGVAGVSVKREEGSVKLAARGKSAHSMEAEKGDNAVFKIFRALHALNGAGTASGTVDWITAHLCNGVTGGALGIDFSDEISGRITVNLVKVEKRDENFVFHLDMRVPVSVTPDEITKKLRAKLPQDAKAELERYMPHLFMPKDCFLVETLLDVYKRFTGDEKADCIVTGGGTYARTMPNCVAFGATFPGDAHNIHSADEWISVDGLSRLADIFAEALDALAKYKLN